MYLSEKSISKRTWAVLAQKDMASLMMERPYMFRLDIVRDAKPFCTVITQLPLFTDYWHTWHFQKSCLATYFIFSTRTNTFMNEPLPDVNSRSRTHLNSSKFMQVCYVVGTEFNQCIRPDRRKRCSGKMWKMCRKTWMHIITPLKTMSTRNQTCMCWKLVVGI